MPSLHPRNCAVPEKPDAVLKLLREYGFTDAHHHIPRLITRFPAVLSASPNKTLLPKLQFFQTIGVPLPVLAHNLSLCPSILRCGLKNFIIPLYNDLKNLLGSDKRVVQVFSRSPRSFSQAWSRQGSKNEPSRRVYMSVSFLRERGVPDSSIASLVMHKPQFLAIRKERLGASIDRAVEMGFDVTESGFVHAVKVFISMSESTVQRKMEVYSTCGWSETETIAAFLRFPYCLLFSEKKIRATMDFFVNEVGCDPLEIARRPVVIGLSLDNRIKPRWLVFRVLKDKGLKKGVGSVLSLLNMSEEKFLEKYVLKYEKDVPELLDIYSVGIKSKSSPLE